MVILVSPLALGAGNSPCCKPDEGNRVIRVFVRLAWSQVPTKNYFFIALRIFALDSKFSVYGHELRVHGHELRASQFLDAIVGPLVSILTNNQAQNSADGSRKLRSADPMECVSTSAADPMFPRK